MTRIEGRTKDAPTPAAPYSQSARVASLVSVAGQVGIVPETGQLVSADLGEQPGQAFSNVAAALAASGAALETSSASTSTSPTSVTSPR